MAQQPIRFDDGDAYEHGMGVWSHLAGQIFLDWLAPKSGLRWIDVGCGNGAFTELLVRRCAPAEIQGIDPSEAQLAFARARTGVGASTFLLGDAMALPFDGARFDAAVMALVIHFVPDPVKGVAEMARVVSPGGTVAAYVWDYFDDGSPSAPVQAELLAVGVTPRHPPSAGATHIATLRDLWIDAGLEAVEAREIAVRRTFVDFEDFWRATTAMPNIGTPIAAMAADDIEQLQARLRVRLPADVSGRIECQARANAVKGRVP